MKKTAKVDLRFSPARAEISICQSEVDDDERMLRRRRVGDEIDDVTLNFLFIRFETFFFRVFFWERRWMLFFLRSSRSFQGIATAELDRLSTWLCLLLFNWMFIQLCDFRISLTLAELCVDGRIRVSKLQNYQTFFFVFEVFFCWVSLICLPAPILLLMECDTEAKHRCILTRVSNVVVHVEIETMSLVDHKKQQNYIFKHFQFHFFIYIFFKLLHVLAFHDSPRTFDAGTL